MLRDYSWGGELRLVLWQEQCVMRMRRAKVKHNIIVDCCLRPGQALASIGLALTGAWRSAVRDAGRREAFPTRLEVSQAENMRRASHRLAAVLLHRVGSVGLKCGKLGVGEKDNANPTPRPAADS
jgi:hypothetical protein